MNTKDFLTITLRLIALIILLFSINSAIASVSLWFEHDMIDLSLLLALVFPLFMFTVTWKFSKNIAHWVANDIDSKISIGTNSFSLLRCLIIITSFYLLLNAVFTLNYMFFNYYIFQSNPEYVKTINGINSIKITISTTLIKVIVSLILLTKNSWITKSLLKINQPENSNN